MFKRNRLYRKLCNSSKMSGSSLPAYSIIYICICIRWYVALALVCCTGMSRLPTSDRPATSDQRIMPTYRPDRPTAPTARLTAAKRRRRPAARPPPSRTVLYGAQSQRRIHARNPRTCTCAICCTYAMLAHDACASHLCACTPRFTHSLPRFRPLGASLALFCALCRLTNDKIDKKICRNIYVICNITHYNLFSSPLKYLFTNSHKTGLQKPATRPQRALATPRRGFTQRAQAQRRGGDKVANGLAKGRKRKKTAAERTQCKHIITP